MRDDTTSSTLSQAEQRAASLSRLGLPPEALPRHIAIIMDGNGRWAADRGKPRWQGHEQGAANVRPIITEAARLGVEVLTLYSFSAENWSRPSEEIEFLMSLYGQYLRSERPQLIENGIRFVHIGRREGLSAELLDELDRTIEASRNSPNLTLAVALNYGSRQEITDAVRTIAEKVKSGELDPAQIEPQTISDHLDTAGLPDPDLLIRTAGEKRISNFLLWQISYAELHISNKCWPDFQVSDMDAAIWDFARRQRRFGAVMPTNPAPVNA
ncbi:MAG: di-trans,poly-cis-decaprenylcistransferase [Phycisphaeraceae bacterium]|nr:di-trans,poly-cis-decaprenylcistransferase [Phycisphaeraceae bacterium]